MKEQNQKKKRSLLIRLLKSHVGRILVVVLLVYLAVVGMRYWKGSQNVISVENSVVSAPIITLGPVMPGVLDKVFVHAGERIEKNMIVAVVDGKPIRAKVNGLVISVQDTPGEIVNSQQGVVNMIEPQKLRVIGHIKENKGLEYIKSGQKVVFTVDAFGSTDFDGVVESVSPSSRQSSLSFSISNNRQEHEFDVKVKFNLNKYPELKNGMSAKMWIYK